MVENNISSDSKQSDEISLKDIILKIKGLYGYLLSKWWMILIAGLVGGLLGIVAALYSSATYTATTTFVLEEGDNGGVGQYAAMAAMVGIDIGGGGGGIFQGDNIIELYQSRSMIQKTLLSEIEYNGKKELLIDYYIRINKLREAWEEDKFLKGVTIDFNLKQGGKFSRIQDSILGKTVETIGTVYLSVDKPDKKLSIIKVEVKSPDEFFSKTFNDLIVATVNKFYVETKTKKSLQTVHLLQRQTDSVRAVMNGAIFASASIADATPNLNAAKQILRAPATRSQFNAETNKTILAELVKNLEISKMALRKETPLIQVIDEPVFPLMKERLGKFRGLIIGGFLGGFLIVLFLIAKRILKGILN